MSKKKRTFPKSTERFVWEPEHITITPPKPKPKRPKP